MILCVISSFESQNLYNSLLRPTGIGLKKNPFFILIIITGTPIEIDSRQVLDASVINRTDLEVDIKKIEDRIEGQNKRLIVVANKVDNTEDQERIIKTFTGIENVIYTSAKKKENIKAIEERLFDFVQSGALNNDVVVTNARHFEALSRSNESLIKVLEGLDNNITGDFLAMDIRQALHQLGLITGDITTDDLLDNIFSKFCIGK